MNSAGETNGMDKCWRGLRSARRINMKDLMTPLKPWPDTNNLKVESFSGWQSRALTRGICDRCAARMSFHGIC